MIRPLTSPISRSISRPMLRAYRSLVSGSTPRRSPSSRSRSALRQRRTSAHWRSSVDGASSCIWHGGEAYSSFSDWAAAERPLGGRLRRAGSGVALGEIEHLDEGRRRLGARHRVLAIDDEARNAIDAEPPGIDVGGDLFLTAVVALQELSGVLAIQADARRALDQDVEVAEIQPILEVGLEQRGDDLVLPLLLGAPVDQAMRQHGVGRALDLGELELDAGLATRFGDRLVDLARPVAAAELGAHVIVPRHALGRHVGIELERPPRDGDIVAPAEIERALEAALADVAPGTDRVGDDVDVDHDTPSLRLSRQCRKTPAKAAIPNAIAVI